MRLLPIILKCLCALTLTVLLGCSTAGGPIGTGVTSAPLKTYKFIMVDPVDIYVAPSAYGKPISDRMFVGAATDVRLALIDASKSFYLLANRPRYDVLQLKATVIGAVPDESTDSFKMNGTRLVGELRDAATGAKVSTLSLNITNPKGISSSAKKWIAELRARSGLGAAEKIERKADAFGRY